MPTAWLMWQSHGLSSLSSSFKLYRTQTTQNQQKFLSTRLHMIEQIVSHRTHKIHRRLEYLEFFYAVISKNCSNAFGISS